MARRKRLGLKRKHILRGQHDRRRFIAGGELLEPRWLRASVSGSGGKGGTTEILALERVGEGTIEYTFDHGHTPDTFKIRYEGETLFDSGFVSGSGSGTVELPEGQSKSVEVIVVANPDEPEYDPDFSSMEPGWRFTAKSDECPNSDPFVFENQGGEFTHDESAGTCWAEGTILIGRKDGISSMLRVDGKVTYSKDSFDVDGTVFSVIGRGAVRSTPLFTGSFTMPFGSGAASSFTDQDSPGQFMPGGQEVTFTGISLQPDGIYLDGELPLPNEIGVAGVTVRGSQGLIIRNDSVAFGPSFSASLPPLDNIKLFNWLTVESFSGVDVSYNAADNVVKLQGNLALNLGSKAALTTVNVNLAGDNFLQIKDGRLDIVGVLSVDTDLKLPGNWGLQEVELTVNTLASELRGRAKLSLPFGKTLEGEGTLAFKTSPTIQLNTMELSLSGMKVPIPQLPGQFITGVSGSLDHLAITDPEPIELGGTVTVEVFPSTIEYTVGGTLSPERLVGTGTVSFTKRGSNTVTGQIIADWSRGIMEIEGSASLANGLVTGTANLKGTSSFDIAGNLDVSLTVPDSIPLFGGKTIANAAADLQFSNDGITTNDYVSAWGMFEVKALGIDVSHSGGVRYWFDGRTTLLNYKPIPPTGSWDFYSGTDWVLVSAQWENATTGPVPVKVRLPNGDWVHEAAFADHGITLVEDSCDDDTRVVLINNPQPGHWDVKLVDPAGLGLVTYAAVEAAPMPAISLTAPATDVSGGLVTVDYVAIDPDHEATVTLFRDEDGIGFDGIQIAADLPEQDGPGSYSWNTRGTAPGTYRIYARIDNGDTTPQFAYADGAVVVTAAVDVAASQSIQPTALFAGDTVTITYSATNQGPQIAEDVTLAGSIDAPLLPKDVYVTHPVATQYEELTTDVSTVVNGSYSDSYPIDLPFPLTFYGETYSAAFVTEDGLVTFDTPWSSGANGDLDAGLPTPTIAVFWDDLWAVEGSIKTATFGPDGDRRFVVEWGNSWFADDWTGPTGPDDLGAQFQLVMYERDSSLQFNYRDLSAGSITNGGTSASVGLSAGGVGDAAKAVTLLSNVGANELVASGKSCRLTPGTGESWFTVTANAGDTFTCETSGVVATALEVFDPTGQSVAEESGNGVDGRNSTLDFTALAGGAYRIRVGLADVAGGTSVLTTRLAVGDLPATATRLFTLTADDSATGTRIRSRVETDTASYDSSDANDREETLIPVTVFDPTLLRTDLSIAFSSAPNSLVLGEERVFEMTVHNLGAEIASGVQVFCWTLPNELLVLAASASQGSVSTADGKLTASLGELAPGGSAVIAFTGKSLSSGRIGAFARVATTASDVGPMNDTAVYSATVAPQPIQPVDLALGLSLSEAATVVGDEVVITATLVNNGPGISTGVAVAAQLPKGLAFVSASRSQGAYDAKTGQWTVGGLAGGASCTLAIRAKLTAGTPIVFSAEVGRSSEPDPDSTPDNQSPSEDDFATATITPGIAIRDVYAVDPGVPLVVSAKRGLLANDFKLAGRKPQAVIVTSPSAGQVTLKTDGSFTYAPGPNYSGYDSFTYRTRDQFGYESNVQSVTLARQIVSFSKPAITVKEAINTTTVTATLRTAPTQSITVPFVVVPKSARTSDFYVDSGSLTFPAGQVSQALAIEIVNDIVDEATESFEIRFGTAPDGLALGGTSRVEVAITDDDPPPVIQVGPNVVEWSEGIADAEQTVWVYMDRPSSNPVRVAYSAKSGTARSGIDFAAVAGVLEFAPGEMAKPLMIPVMNDTLYESNETFSVSLSSPVFAKLGKESTCKITITNDDALPVVLFALAASSSLVESGSSVIEVKLSKASGLPVRAAYRLSGGSATVGKDFTVRTGTLTFAPGEVRKTITVALRDDTSAEDDETIDFSLFNPQKATLGAITTHRLTIRDDD